MASLKPSLRQASQCLRCVRPMPTPNANGPFHRVRLLSTSAIAREEVQTQPSSAAQPSPPPAVPPSAKPTPEYMQKWGTLDPNQVDTKRDERRIMRRDGVLPIGSRRRRATLRRSTQQNLEETPFEQLPYQCFQEARKVLLEDRQEKLKQIEVQTMRLKNLLAQDPALSGGPDAKEARIRSMRNYINELVILADINDPIVKKKFEDGQGDLNKPIYRHLADNKWRQYKRLILEQRLTQMSIVPDLLPNIDPIVDIDLGFSRQKIEPGEFVDSAVSEQPPRLRVQSFEQGEKLVTVVVVDADVPVPEKDGFNYRCHFVASNVTISPTQTSIAFNRLAEDDKKATDPSAKKIALPWLPPWANRGAPYHRLAIFVLEQQSGKALSVENIVKTKRDGFILRSFIDKHKLKTIGATVFRTKWDESMAGVMRRNGLADQVNIEFKRKRVEPMPYKRRTERMR
ncbi:phosphatidylethanolamine-binding protein [Lophiotrema nucula]|uniref:Large ribosomal subunit protein mL38 n=1 Tax=Lophiotrema nucula TaxID=690887 RepID=A0A6A5ZX71_9PLEO|nr:phosphatidylethanolamine-binding protein [Lophiotrema nucula]